MIGRDPGEQIVEQIEPTVNVANGIDASPLWYLATRQGLGFRQNVSKAFKHIRISAGRALDVAPRARECRR